MQNLSYFSPTCTLCHRTTTHICECSLPFCECHFTLHGDVGHHIAHIWDIFHQFFADENKEGDLQPEEQNCTENGVKALPNFPFGDLSVHGCTHIGQWEKWALSRDVLEKFEDKSAKDESKSFKYQSEEEKNVKCQNCDAKDVILCLSCLLPFCARKEVIGDGNAHMKQHWGENCPTEKQNASKSENSSNKKNLSGKTEIIPSSSLSHGTLALKNNKIFCYTCDRQVFSFIYFFVMFLSRQGDDGKSKISSQNENFAENQKIFIKNLNILAGSEYFQRLSLAQSKILAQNRDLYAEQKELFDLNEKQQELLFKVEAKGVLYNLAEVSRSEQEDEKSQDVRKSPEVYPLDSPKHEVKPQNDLPFIRGITNTGNTCYLNSMVQLMSDLVEIEQFERTVTRMHFSGNKSKEIQADSSYFSPICFDLDAFLNNPKRCLDCQFLRALNSVRHHNVTLDEGILVNEQFKNEEKIQTESKNPQDASGDISNSMPNQITGRVLPAITLDTLQRCLETEGVILKDGKMQDSTELLFRIFDRISQNDHYLQNEEECHEENGFLRNLKVEMVTQKSCEECKTTKQNVETRHFLMKNEIDRFLSKSTENSSESCEKCGNCLQIVLFLRPKRFVLVMNECFNVDGMTFCTEIPDDLVMSAISSRNTQNNGESPEKQPEEQKNEEKSNLINHFTEMGYDLPKIEHALSISTDPTTAFEILLSLGNDFKQPQNTTKKNEKSESNIDFGSANVPSEVKLRFFSAVKFYSEGTMGHYIYHRRLYRNSGHLDFAINDDEIVLVKDDYLLKNGRVLVVYEVCE